MLGGGDCEGCCEREDRGKLKDVRNRTHRESHNILIAGKKMEEIMPRKTIRAVKKDDVRKGYSISRTLRIL